MDMQSNMLNQFESSEMMNNSPMNSASLDAARNSLYAAQLAGSTENKSSALQSQKNKTVSTDQMFNLENVEYFEDFENLSKDDQIENFEKALYRLKGGFGASKRGGPRAFYSSIDEVRDHFVNGTSMEISQNQSGNAVMIGDWVSAKSLHAKTFDKS